MFDDGVSDGLSIEPLATERLCLVSCARVAATDSVTLGDALSLPLVLPDARDGLRVIIESAARAAGLVVSNLVSEVSSLTVIKNAVLRGVGATILPLSCVSPEVRQGALRAYEITDPAVVCTVVLCTRKDALLSRVAASVFRLTVTTARQLCLEKSWIGAVIEHEHKPSQS